GAVEIEHQHAGGLNGGASGSRQDKPASEVLCELAKSNHGSARPVPTECRSTLVAAEQAGLSQVRLDMQQALLDAGIQRTTPVEVTPDGVIWDGHHAVRIAAEKGLAISVKCVNVKVNPTAASILLLPVS